MSSDDISPIAAGAGQSAAPGTLDLFLGFLGLGMTAFGGALPLARAMLVDRRGWLASTEFTELLGLCQFLPGGNVVNLSVAVGMKFRGARGAVAALLGLVAVPTLVVIVLGAVYARFGADPHVRHMFAGLAAAAAGLLVTMAVKLAWPLRGKWGALVLASACVIAIGGLRLPMLPVMVVLTAVSLFASWRASR